jgi:hypothetical protein
VVRRYANGSILWFRPRCHEQSLAHLRVEAASTSHGPFSVAARGFKLTTWPFSVAAKSFKLTLV